MRHRLTVAAAALEKAGFAAAAFAYLAPFFSAGPNSRVPVVLGVQAFFNFLFVFLLPQANVLMYYGPFVIPAIAAVAGLLLPRRLTWPASIARMACALAGLGGLATIYVFDVFDPRVNLLIGYYAAEAAFVVAAIASTYRLFLALRLRSRGEYAREPGDPRPAWSASQELLRRHRDT